MSNFEALPDNHEIVQKHQSPTKHGREIEHTRRLEVRKENAEQTLSELLNLLTEKLNRSMTLEDLSVEFGQSGENLKHFFYEVMNGQDEGQLIIEQAHFLSACNELRKQIETQH